jgi:hypothetical protein
MLACYQAVPQFIADGINPWRSKWTIYLAVLLLNIFLGGALIWGISLGFFGNLLMRLETISLAGVARVSVLTVVPAALGSFLLIHFKIFGTILPQFFPSLWVFLWLSLVAAIALKVSTKISLLLSFVTVLLFQGAMFRIWGILNVVTDFPFTIDYSETSRFYYGSLVFSRSLYGMDLPLSILHPSRYLLQAIPFIIPGLPLWIHRLWQALLWIVLTGISAWLLTRRMKFSSGYLTIMVAVWGFVYFLQGAVYYHLQVCIIIILFGYSKKHPARTLLVVILSSLWAGISRINWFPVPAMLAIALYLLDEPVSTSKNLWQYLKYPILWAGTGLFAAFLSQVLYVFWSGNFSNASDFGSSFTSDLIWSRLLPNVTYPLGVIPGILIVSTPLFILLFYTINRHPRNWHFIRPLGLLAMLSALFLGGFVVSTKIGGGADIHNMDAFMILLAIVTCRFFADRVVPEKAGNMWGDIPVWVVLLAVFIPVTFSLQNVHPRFSYDHAQAQKDLSALQKVIKNTQDQGGEILFISERQLVMFHMVGDVRLIPDYEIVTLMEMAMSGNQAYLARFDKDLAMHRFALIITNTQRVVKKANEPFAEENNVWIDSISRPLLCYYQRSLTLESSNTLILVPAQTSGNCP